MTRPLPVFDKDTKSTPGRKDGIFNKCCWESRISTHMRTKLDHNLILSTEFNSKWIVILSIISDCGVSFRIWFLLKHRNSIKMYFCFSPRCGDTGRLWIVHRGSLRFVWCARRGVILPKVDSLCNVRILGNF